MNAGAAAATGEWFLFLHADSRLPPGWTAHLRRAAVDATGGWFRFALDDPAWQARLIERGVAWRVRLFRLPYGDQGLFVRRQVFVALGGFRELPLLEDVDFVRRLVRSGRAVRAAAPAADLVAPLAPRRVVPAQRPQSGDRQLLLRRRLTGAAGALVHAVMWCGLRASIDASADRRSADRECRSGPEASRKGPPYKSAIKCKSLIANESRIANHEWSPRRRRTKAAAGSRRRPH